MVADTAQAVQQLVEEGAGYLGQSASTAQATHLQAAAHILSALGAHTSMAHSALVATAENMAGVATSASAHLQGTVEQALVVVAT